MGRPPHPPERVRNQRVVVMMTAAELAALDRLADREGKPCGTIAYELLAAALRRAR